MAMFQARAATSAVVRPGQCGSCCQNGLATYAEQPLPVALPPAFQTRSAQPRALLALASWVPPTAVIASGAGGEVAAGQPSAVIVARFAGKLAAVNPWSPEATTMVCPAW